MPASMACHTAPLSLAIAAVAICWTLGGAKATALENSSPADLGNEVILPRTLAPNIDEDAEELDVEPISLLQTDVHVYDSKKESQYFRDATCTSKTSSMEAESGMFVRLLKRAWQWVTQADANTMDATEAAKRFHKDFIAAALLMTSVLPWSHSSSSNDRARRGGQRTFAGMIPSSQALRFLCVLLLWLKHYCFHSHHSVLEISFVIVGVVFDFANKHCNNEDDMWTRLGEMVPQSFARLYPFYALYVIGYYFVFFSSPCNPIETLLGGNLLLSYSCALGAWLVSVVFGCYLVATVLADPPQHSQSSSTAMIYAGCVAMIVLPRTLAAPVHGPWTWSADKVFSMRSDPAGVGYDIFFTRRSLLLGLAHYFFGLVLARIWLALKTASSSSELLTDATGSSVQDSQHASKTDADLWKAFEDEAQREILGSLSVNRADEQTVRGYSMSPRSNSSE